MGYAVVPDITDESVVCQGGCQHTDCAQNRAEWGDAKCAICGEPMLPGQAYYMHGDRNAQPRQHAHAGCVWDEAERRV